MLKTLLYIVFLFLVNSSLSAQTKRALLVGISDYGGTDEQVDSVWSNIHGANDVELILPTLKSQSFTIKTIKDKQATAQNIRKEFAGNEGDSVSALNFQMANLLLVDDHVEYFYSKGLDDDAYFANWYVTITLASALSKKNIAIPMFIKMLQKINAVQPFNRLPFYVESLAYVLYDCKDPDYKDSVFLLQNTLNVIKQLLPTKDLVNQYISICNSFFTNRFYNSFDGPIFVEDRLADCEKWFYENKDYIDRLSGFEYESEIAQFYLKDLEDTKTLCIFAA